MEVCGVRGVEEEEMGVRGGWEYGSVWDEGSGGRRDGCVGREE